jgi:hypothetical protein
LVVSRKRSFNQAQRKSELFKHGDDIPSHNNAVAKICKLLDDKGFTVLQKYHLFVTGYLGHWTIYNEFQYEHFYDIYAEKKNSNRLITKIIVEVDGSSHDSVEQQKRDKTARLYAEFFINDVIFVRAKIGDILANSEQDLYTWIINY